MYNHCDILKQKLIYQHALANHLITAVIVLDSELRIVYVNPAAEALLVKSLSRLYGMSTELIFANTTINTKRLQQLLKTGQEFSDSDITITLNEEHRFTAEITASPVEFTNDPHVLLELKQIDQQKLLKYLMVVGCIFKFNLTVPNTGG